MRVLQELFDNNRAWADRVRAAAPDFFEQLALQQQPEYLWIGCADSRVPANEIVGMLPGEIFVHRNVANIVVHTDFNCLSVLQFAVDLLKVKHVIVCGHYGCGGIAAALENSNLGLIDNWLRNVRDVHRLNAAELERIESRAERVDRLCELNVAAQVANVCDTTIVRAAWARGQELSVHGWIYALRDGLLRDLGVCVTSAAEADTVRERTAGPTER
ncbi:MAG: carbonate dehydratase [Thermoanaerobaculia bacterium]|nr:carbonate dehydratase [Thermoanaerobaculia bacterium]